VASVAIHGALLAFWLSDVSVSKSDGTSEVIIELVKLDVDTDIDVNVEQRSIQRSKPSVSLVTKKDDRAISNQLPVATVKKEKPNTPVILVTTVSAPVNKEQKATVLAQSVLRLSKTPTAVEAIALKPDLLRQDDAVALERVRLLVRSHLESFKYYPASARRRGIAGYVDVGFMLTKNGSADQVSVVHGSGYAVLDHAALKTVHRAQPFPVEGGAYRFRLRFKQL